MKIGKRTIKVISLSALCFAAVLTFALIPVNLFCVNFPEWITSLLSILFFCGLIVYLIIFKTGLAAKTALPVVFGIAALVCSFAPYLIPYWSSYSFKEYNGVILNYDEVISYSAAENDLLTLKHYLEKIHPMFKNGITEEVEGLFLQAAERLKTAERITINDFRREIQIILHSMYDAHTTTYNNFPNDKYLKAYVQKNYEGYYIAAINGKTVSQIFEDAKPYYCYETENWISIDLGSLASLDFLGYTAPFTFEWTNGDAIISETYTEKDFVSWSEYIEIYNQYFSSDGNSNGFVYYEIDEDKSLAILTLTQCNYNRTYIDCVKSMFTEVKTKNIQNIAVDLRGNGGGNSLVANEFIKYLPVDSYLDVPCDLRAGFLTIHYDGKISNRRYKDLTFNGKVYALTDTGSFSAAMDFAMIIQDNHLGTVIGEPSANSVNGYGDVVGCYLPNTGLFVQISSKKWYRIDKQNTNDYVVPDYPCEGKKSIDVLYEIVSLYQTDI